MIDRQVVLIEKVGVHGDIIKMSISPGVDMKTAIPQLAQVISGCFKNGNYKIILNLEHITFPSASFIALLIEMTSQARRSNGDIKLININVPAKNNFVTFTPLNYLSMDMDEEYALEDFDALAPSKKPIPLGVTTEDSAMNVNESRPHESLLDQKNKLQVAGKASDKAGPIDIEKKDLSPIPSIRRQLDVNSRRRVSQQHMKKTHKFHPEKEVSTAKKLSPQTLKHDGKVTVDVNKSEETQKLPNDKSKGYRIRVKSKNDSLYKICDFVIGLAKKTGMPGREIGKVKVTVYEACLNVIEHAYHSDPDEWIVVTVNIKEPEFIITIQDWGESFRLGNAKPYDVNQAMWDRKTGGFGLHIIRRSMDDVQYKTDPINGNRLILKKIIHSPF